MAYKETWSGKISRKLVKKQRIIDVAAGRQKADLVLKNATYVNVFSGQLETEDIAVAEGLIVGLGEYAGLQEVDMTGKAGVQSGKPGGICPGRGAPRHHHRHHRSPRDNQRHGHRRH